MKIFILSICSLIIGSLSGQTVSNKTITIDPYLSFQNYEHFKRLTLSSPNSSVEYLEGFEFAWGYKYELNVKETILGEWLSDGTRYNYSLNKIISKTKVPDSTQFMLYLDPTRYYYELDSSEQEINITLKPINDSTFLYFEKVEIEVPEFLRKKFNSILERKTGTRGTFLYVNENRIRLIRL